MSKLTLEKIDKKILKNLTSRYPDFVEYAYLLEMRKYLTPTLEQGDAP